MTEVETPQAEIQVRYRLNMFLFQVLTFKLTVQLKS